jgi:hypothetical protein
MNTRATRGLPGGDAGGQGYSLPLTLTRRHTQEDGLRVGRPGAVDIGDRGSCAQAELQLGVVSSVRQSEEECPHAAAARDGSGTAEARAVARRV